MLFNIHTHQQPSENEWCIQNLYQDFEQTHSLALYSMGIHPWYIDEQGYKMTLEKIKIHAVKKNVLAIGECGLDRLCDTSFKLQEAIFKSQIEWANDIAKPIIVHCVKAHQECIQILKSYNNIMPVIFHGFHNKWEVAEKLLNAGFYLSFGQSLFNPAMEKVFASTPLDRIFLETDDSNYKIQEIYQKATSIRQISTDQLNSQIRKNIQTIFNLQIQ